MITLDFWTSVSDRIHKHVAKHSVDLLTVINPCLYHLINSTWAPASITQPYLRRMGNWERDWQAAENDAFIRLNMTYVWLMFTEIARVNISTGKRHVCINFGETQPDFKSVWFSPPLCVCLYRHVWESDGKGTGSERAFHLAPPPAQEDRLQHRDLRSGELRGLIAKTCHRLMLQVVPYR